MKWPVAKSEFIRCAKWLFASALLFGSTTLFAEGIAETPITSKCSECHGTSGISEKSGVPHIDGQPEEVLTNMISSFREGKRPTQVQVHRDLTAPEITTLATHYSRQKVLRPKAATKTELISRGENLYLDRCAQCHVDFGRDSDKGAPLMAAQISDYLFSQMQAFRSGARKFPFLMDEAYKNLSEDDFAAIAEFFAAQEQVAPEQKRRRRR
jgi:cytochrome c553